jgi:hypothetical protein
MKKLLSAFIILTLLAFKVGTAIAAPAPDVAKVVTFIFLADKSGNPLINAETNAPVPNGTGFFVIVRNEDGPGGYGYLVTAKHVLKDTTSQFFSRVFLRINLRAGGSQFIPLDLHPDGKDQNIFVHGDPTVDIAVIPAYPDEKLFDFLALPTELIKTKEDFKNTKIVPGSDVFFTGLFVPYYGDRANVPIFRFGRVAMLPDDRIRWQDNAHPPEFVELYLLETMSFGGNSGSPVFFSQGADREPGMLILGPPVITLAGVMRGNFNESRVGGVIQTPNAVLPVFAQNIGIAAVTPAHLLRDILYSEPLKIFRADHPIK